MPLKTTAGNHGEAAKGRGATINPEGRFERWAREGEADDWFQSPDGAPSKPRTVIAIEQAKSVISRNDSPDVGFSQSINPYRGCAHGCTYCTSGSTEVLMADGRARRISDLRVGDEIFGTDLVGSDRRYKKTRVLAHWGSIKLAFRVTLEDGTAVVASSDHRFLTGRGWRHVGEWSDAGVQRPHFAIGDTFVGMGVGWRSIPRLEGLEGQTVQSDAKLGVVSIESLGEKIQMYDITTGTEDFIANGIVSHNCFARPSHGYLGLSPGVDFETRLSAKTNAAEVLRQELAKPGYRCEPLIIGVNTDAYQPVERDYRITRAILEVCREANQPVSLITKSALIERDLDILAPMAREGLVHATLSVTTLDHEISRYMEPRTSAPARRILAIERLTAAGIPVNVNVAPVIPFLTDSELEPILEAAAKAGAKTAGYVLVRLPWEVKDIFRAWLEERFPLKAAHVMSRIHEMRGGRDNDPRFGTRQTGEGLLATLLRQRFDKACKRLGLNMGPDHELDCSRFRPPSPPGQARLF